MLVLGSSIKLVIVERTGTLQVKQEKHQRGLGKPTLSFPDSRLQPGSKQPVSGNLKSELRWIAVEWSQVPYRASDVYPSSSSMVNGLCNVEFPGKVGLEHRHWFLSHYRARNRCRIPGKGK